MSAAAAIQTEAQRELLLRLPADGSQTQVSELLGVPVDLQLFTRGGAALDDYLTLGQLVARGLVAHYGPQVRGGAVRLTAAGREAQAAFASGKAQLTPLSAESLIDMLAQLPSFTPPESQPDYGDDSTDSFLAHERGVRAGHEQAIEQVRQWLDELRARMQSTRPQPLVAFEGHVGAEVFGDASEGSPLRLEVVISREPTDHHHQLPIRIESDNHAHSVPFDVVVDCDTFEETPTSASLLVEPTGVARAVFELRPSAGSEEHRVLIHVRQFNRTIQLMPLDLLIEIA